MSHINLTNLERIQALRRFGYSEREAAFLCLAALHSGFFLRRQYCQFIHKQIGGTAATLTQKLLANDHATAAAGLHNTKVYHLCSRPLYAALGQEDNRNRRERPPFAIKNKVMSLDFVLDHQDYESLATEQEKVSYFTRTLGIDPAALPAKLFRSPTAKEATAHYFPDKYPIFFSKGADAAQPLTSFCYVDEGQVTCSRFDTYLAQYRDLFASLPHFQLIYVAESDASFGSAESVFQAFMSELKSGSEPGASDATIARLLDHFLARHLYETGQLESFDRAKLVRLRNDSEEFSGAKYQALYECWKSGGELLVHQSLSLVPRPNGSTKAAFSTHLLRHNYDLFSTISRIQRGEGSAEHEPTAAL